MSLLKRMLQLLVDKDYQILTLLVVLASSTFVDVKTSWQLPMGTGTYSKPERSSNNSR